MIEIGTRTPNSALTIAPPQGTIESGFTRDVGMRRRIAAASLTFTASTGRISGANGTFVDIAINRIIFVQNSNRNDGYFEVTARDNVNFASITVSPPPKDEGPVTVTMRTA